MRRFSRSLLLGLACGALAAAQDHKPPQDSSPVESPATLPQKQSAPMPSLVPAGSPSTASSDAAPDPLGEARVLIRKGDFDAAIEKYQQLLQERPKSPDAYAGLTRVYLKKKDVAEAYATVTRALQVNDSWPVRIVLGEVYFRQGRISDAEKEWVDVVNAGHQAARAYLGLARVRWAVSKYKSARLMIDKAHALDPKDPDIEQEWIINTLGPRERITNLQAYLATMDSNDPTRSYIQRYLDYLKAKDTSDLSCSLEGKMASTETSMVRMLIDPEHLRGYGLSVFVNGEKSRLLLDTGASGILLDRGMAERAGVTKLTETRIGGIGDHGSKPGYVAVARSIHIGGLEFRNCPVEVVETRSFLGEDGLIGADVFEHFLVDIDFPTEKLRLQELPKRPEDAGQPVSLNASAVREDAETPADAGAASPEEPAVPPAPGPGDRYVAPEMRSYTPVYRFGHDLLVQTKVGETPGKLFLLDTGAIDNTISTDTARQVTKVGRDAHSGLRGLSGSVSRVYNANKAVLQFGNIRQENQDMLSFDLTSMSEDAGTEISGTLGFTLLRLLEVKIDYRDGLVDFNYDPKRLIHF